jgi:pilus assembly protein Flp/PilA
VNGFARERSGVTAVEYAIIAALVATVIVGAVFTLGNHVSTLLFNKVASSL